MSIPGPKITLSGMGEGVGRGAGADWDRTRRSGVGVTGPGGSVGALRARQRIEAEVYRSRSGVTSAGHEVGARLPRAVVLGVKAE